MSNKNTPPAPDSVQPVIPEPTIQMTPVEFSPLASDDAIGTVKPESRPPFEYPVFVPLTIILLTLIFSTVRDIIALNKRLTAINTDNVPALEVLKKSGNQLEFRDALRNGIQQLAPTDPVAAQVAREFFPAPPPKKESVPDLNAPLPKQ